MIDGYVGNAGSSLILAASVIKLYAVCTADAVLWVALQSNWRRVRFPADSNTLPDPSEQNGRKERYRNRVIFEADLFREVSHIREYGSFDSEERGGEGRGHRASGLTNHVAAQERSRNISGCSDYAMEIANCHARDTI